MPDDLAQIAVAELFSEPLSRDRFERWREVESGRVGDLLSAYVFGEIIWRKELGRPHTKTLSKGFEIEAWRDEPPILVGIPGGAAYWLPVTVDCPPSWHDGRDDEEYWRIAFMVAGLTAGRSANGLHEYYNYIVPKLRRTVWWNVPGGPFGIGLSGARRLEPPDAMFMKEEGPGYLSFEVVTTPLFRL